AAMPIRSAWYATACAWLPAETASTPLARSSLVSWAILLSAPRSLNEAVNCRFSNFRKTSQPQICDSVRDARHGVAPTSPARRADRESRLSFLRRFAAASALALMPAVALAQAMLMTPAVPVAAVAVNAPLKPDGALRYALGAGGAYASGTMAALASANVGGE